MKPKQIAYFYHTLLTDAETELDVDGTVAVSVKGDTRPHAGKTWQVKQVETDRAAPSALPSTACI